MTESSITSSQITTDGTTESQTPTRHFSVLYRGNINLERGEALYHYMKIVWIIQSCTPGQAHFRRWLVNKNPNLRLTEWTGQTRQKYLAGDGCLGQTDLRGPWLKKTLEDQHRDPRGEYLQVCSDSDTVLHFGLAVQLAYEYTYDMEGNRTLYHKEWSLVAYLIRS